MSVAARSDNVTVLIPTHDRSLADIENVLATTLHRERHAVVDIGRLLTEAKKKVDHGQWLYWLTVHFGKSERTAQNYMRAAEWASKNATVADLKLRPSAIYWLSQDAGRGLYIQGVHLATVRADVEAAVFALAKTKWIDRDDCEEVFLTAARNHVAKHTAARVKDEKAKGGYVNGAAERRKKKEDRHAAMEAERAARIAEARRVKTPDEREAAAIEHLKRARRGNLYGSVRALITLSPHVADLVGAVQPEKLEKLVEFLKALVDLTIAGASESSTPVEAIGKAADSPQVDGLPSDRPGCQPWPRAT
jgi:Protein of unknown function (DUF3102)